MTKDLEKKLKNSIPLSAMIETLRSELQQAMSEGEGQRLRFDLENVELTLQVGATRQGKGEGKIRFWVVDLGASETVSNSALHTFKLNLKPCPGIDGKPPKISAKTKGLPG